MPLDLQPLHALRNEHCNWEVRSIILQLSKTPQQTEPESIDLVSKVKSHVIVPSERFQPAEDKDHILWFPPTVTIANGRSSINYHLNDANGSSSIKKLLNHALKQCSCSVIQLRKNKTKNNTRFTFSCPRAKRAGQKDAPLDGKPQRDSTTARVHDIGDLCRFQIIVHFHHHTKRWYLRLDAGHNFLHANHHKGLHQIRKSRHDLPLQVLETASNMLDHGTPTTHVRALTQTLTDVNLPTKAFTRILEESLHNGLGGIFTPFNPHGERNTPGQMLLDWLRFHPDLDFVIYTATLDDSMHRLRLRKKTKTKDGLIDPAKYHTQRLQALVEGLTLDTGREALIAVSFVSKKQRRFFEMFPECLGMDVTHGTNAEKRPLFRLVGRTASNENIPLMTAYLPSLCEWVFHWLFDDAMPTLFGKENVAKLRLMMTDEDLQCMAAFNAIIKVYYPYAQIRLCKWHKVNRNYSIRAPTKTEVDLQFANRIRDWCYSFTSSIESAKEEKDSWNALLTFVDNMDKEGNVTKDLIRFTRKYLTTFFNKSMEYLSFRHYMAVPNGDRADNCFVESDNSSIKRLDQGPKPSNKIHVSALKLAQRDIAYVNNLTVKSIKCSVSTSTRSQQTNTSVQDANLQELTTHIIKSKASLAVEQHCLGSNCYIYYPGLSNSKEQTFYVRENLIRASVTRFTSWRPVVPRTRTVTITESTFDQGAVFTCSCGFFQRSSIVCRHIYCLLGRPPSHADFPPQCSKHYIPMSLQCDQYLMTAQQISERILKSGGLSLAPTYPFKVPLHVQQQCLGPECSGDTLVGTLNQPDAVSASTPRSPIDSPIEVTQQSPTMTRCQPSLSEYLLGGRCDKKMYSRHLKTYRTLTSNCVSVEISQYFETQILKLLTEMTRMASQSKGEIGSVGLVGMGTLTTSSHSPRQTHSPKHPNNRPTKKQKTDPQRQLFSKNESKY